MKEKTQLERMDKKVIRKFREIMSERITKGLAQPTPREISIAETTRLMLKCPSWQQVERELKTLPKKKNE